MGNGMSFNPSRLILDQLAALKADERRKGDKIVYLDLGGNVGAHAIAVASRQLNIYSIKYECLLVRLLVCSL